MPRFRVLEGRHRSLDGVTYKKDEIVESDRDLDKEFINKFERISSVDERRRKKKKNSSKKKVTVSSLKNRGRKIGGLGSGSEDD